MVEWLRVNLKDVIFISLDHDLELLPGENGRMVDCGTGREVADFLATQPARCPVVIHSTNYPAAAGMEIVLTDAGWSVDKIAPYGGLEWMNETWFPAVQRRIREWTFMRNENLSHIEGDSIQWLKGNSNC